MNLNHSPLPLKKKKISLSLSYLLANSSVSNIIFLPYPFPLNSFLTTTEKDILKV